MDIRGLIWAMSVSLVASGVFAVEVRPDEYRLRKRMIHEKMTGEKLDEYGHVLRPTVEAEQNKMSSNGRRLLAASTPLVVSNVKMEQRKDSKLVDIYYDLTGGSGNRCRVTIDICDDSTCIRSKVLEGVVPGKKLHYEWDAGSEWPNHFSTKVNATITAEDTDIPVAWADIYVYWDSFDGRDLDICGYWEDCPTVKVGWSWGSGTENEPYQSKWFGDDVNKGPEHIIVKASGSGISGRRYKVHLNYFGEMGSPCKAKVVVSSNGKTLSETQNASKRLETCANRNDPCVIITFDDRGTPIAITKGN